MLVLCLVRFWFLFIYFSSKCFSHINTYFNGPLEIYSLLMNLSQSFLCSSSSGNLKTAHFSCPVKLEKHPLQEHLLTILSFLSLATDERNTKIC